MKPIRPDALCHQKNILKDQTNHLQTLQRCQKDAYQRSKKATDPIERRQWLLLNLIYHLLEKGYRDELAITWISQLTWGKLREALKPIDANDLISSPCPVHFEETRSITHPISFNPGVKSIFKKLLTLRPGKGQQSFHHLVIDAPQNANDLPEESHASRFRSLQTQFEGLHKQLDKTSFRRLSQSVQNHLLAHSAVPAGLFHALQDHVAPSGPSEDCGITFETLTPVTPYSPLTTLDVFNDQFIKTEAQRRRRLTHRTTGLDKNIKESDYAKALTGPLKTVESLLKSKAFDKKLKSAKNKKTFAQEIGTVLHKPLLNNFSAASYGVLWCRELMLSGSIKGASMAKYVSLIIRRYLIHQPNAWNIGLWDQEDVDGFIHDFKESTHWKSSTREYNLQLLLRFLHFCQLHGELSDVELPRITKGYHQIRYRNHLIAPVVFDPFILDVAQHPFVKTHNAALIYILAYYGSLRVIEITHLTINDIHIVENEVWINVRVSKSEAGKRTVPLHAFAPTEILDRFIQLVDERYAQFDHVNIASKNIFLIGEDEDPETQQPEHGVLYALTLLKSVFGDALDLHTLRHNFVSWSFLRLFSQLPAINNLLNHYAPNLLEPKCHHQLERHLSWGRHQPSSEWTHLFVELSRITGHANFQTTALHYTHTLGPVVNSLMSLSVDEVAA